MSFLCPGIQRGRDALRSSIGLPKILTALASLERANLRIEFDLESFRP